MLKFLATLFFLAIVCAGCLDDPYTAGDGGHQFIIADESTVVAEDQYFSSGFELYEAAVFYIEAEVHSGPNVDIILVDQTNFRQFEQGNGYVHFSTCGGVAAQGFTRSCNLSAGTYYLIVDNSDAGATSPPFNGVDDGAHVSWYADATS